MALGTLVAISSGISALSGLISGHSKAKAQKRALRTLRENQEKAISTIEKTYGGWGKAQEEIFEAMRKEAFGGKLSRLYRLQVEETEKGLGRALAARGLMESGAAVRAYSENIRRLAAEEAERQWRRQAEVAEMGIRGGGQALQRGGMLANIYTGTAGQIAELQTATPWAGALEEIAETAQTGLKSYTLGQILRQKPTIVPQKEEYELKLRGLGR